MRRIVALSVIAFSMLTVTACNLRKDGKQEAAPSPSVTTPGVLDPSSGSSPGRDFDNEPGMRRLLNIDSEYGSQNAGTVKVKKGVVWVRFTCKGSDNPVVVHFKPLGSFDFKCPEEGRQTLNQLNLDNPRELTFSVATDEMSENTHWGLRVSQK